MRITNDWVSDLHEWEADRIGAHAPLVWYGQRPLDGTVAPWSTAPMFSQYHDRNLGVSWQKQAENSVAADWQPMAAVGSGVHEAAAWGADGQYATDARAALAALLADTTGGVIHFGPGIHRFTAGDAVTVTDSYLLDVDPNGVLWVDDDTALNIHTAQPIDVRWFGAHSQGAATGTGCGITAGSDQLTIDSGTFRVGQGLAVPTAGTGSAGGNANPLFTRIKAVSGTTLTLEDAAVQTATNVRCLGDDSSAFNHAIQVCFSGGASSPRQLYVPAGTYEIMQPILADQEFALIGEHRLRTLLYQPAVDGYHWADCILRIDGNVNLDVENLRFYNDGIGTCIYSPKRLAYTSGGTYEPKQGDVLFGHDSGAIVTPTSYSLSSGVWADGTAVGTMYLATQTGTFEAENLDVVRYGAAATLVDGLHTAPTTTLTVVDTSVFTDDAPSVSPYKIAFVDVAGNYEHRTCTVTNPTTLELSAAISANVASGTSVYILSRLDIAAIIADPTYGSQLIDSLITHCWFAGHGYGFSQASAMDVLASTTTISDCAIEMLNDGIILRGGSAGCHLHNLTVWMIENQAIAFLGGSAHKDNVYNCQISNVIHSTTYTNGGGPCTINVEYGRDIQISNVGVHNHMSAAPIVTTGLYAWVDSGTNDEWYLTYDGGTVANVVIQPHVLLLDGSQMATGTIGTLTGNTWAWGTGALAYSTIYVKLTAGGAPATSAVYRMWYSDAAIRLYLCQSILIDGLTAENVVDVPTSGDIGALVVWGGTQQSIRNLHAVNRVAHPVATFNLAPTHYMHHGIWAQAVTNFHVSDFYIENTDEEGIIVDTSATNVTIEKGYIKKTGTGSVGTYASLKAPANCIGMTVRDVTFEQASGSTYALDLSLVPDGGYFLADACNFDWGAAIWALFNATENALGRTAIQRTGVGLSLPFIGADATPSVGHGSSIYLADTNAISDLDDGYLGQQVTIVMDGASTVDFTGTNLRGNAGADWTPAAGDFMTCVKGASGVWYCTVVEGVA